MPFWLIAYIPSALVAAVVLARRNFGFEDGPRLLPTFLVWVASIAIVGLVLWTLIACTYLHRQQLSFIAPCLIGSAIWASVIVGLYVPGYAVILAALVRFQKQVRMEGKWRLVAAALALPAGLALFLGYAWPDYFGDSTDFEAGVAPGLMAWASMYGALLLTRGLQPVASGEVPVRAV